MKKLESSSSHSLGVTDRPLRVFLPTTSTESTATREQLSIQRTNEGRPFDNFLQAAFSVILAVVFAWRLLLFSFKDSRREADVESGSRPRAASDGNNNLEQEFQEATTSGLSPTSSTLTGSSSSSPYALSCSQDEDDAFEMDPSIPFSLRGLLSTDALPEGVASSSSDEDDFIMHPPPPHLLNIGQLDIIEEESDEARSISSASFASPRTVLDANTSRRSDYRSISSLSTLSDYRSPTSQFSPLENQYEEGAATPVEEEVIEETPTAREATPPAHSQSLEKEETTESPEIMEDEPSSAEVTVIERRAEKVEEQTEMVQPVLSPGDAENRPPLGTDQLDQEEKPPERETRSPEGLLKGLAQLGSEPRKVGSTASSSTTASTRSLLTEIMAEAEREKEKRDAEDKNQPNDADRDTTEEIVFETTKQRPTPMEDARSLDSVSLVLNESRDSVLDHSLLSNPVDETAIVERSMYKYSEDPRSSYPPPSPPADLPPPPPSIFSAPTPTATSTASTILRPTAQLSSIVDPIDVDLEGSMQRVARYGQVYSDSAKSHVRQDYEEDDMLSSPPPMAPPPPPSYNYPPSTTTAIPMSVTSSHIPVYTTTITNGHSAAHPPPGSTKSYSSREDLLGSEHAPSRSTVREIPVLRAASAAPSAHSTLLDYHVQPPPSTHLSSYGDHRDRDMHDEYYRREVLTRTIITRSTEALSQPPLRSSSPMERYITYPSDDIRETREVEYREKRVHDIEEEERRITEDREKRRLEEEDRRRRDEEVRREWDRREKDVLERLRRERELKERDLEAVRADRERVELDRIDKDRRDRENAERLRREEWERRENERRALEDTDLDRRRIIERERMERERLLEEQREKERLEIERQRMERERVEREKIERERMERERIERERIERERIEIERIERIKREKIERERKEREREKEEADRLIREREELERIERERRELEIRERELLIIAQREAEQRERERLADEERERRRRAEEAKAAAYLADLERAAAEKERQRQLQEQQEHDRLERLRIEQERREWEKQEFDRREKDRQEEERRELELLDAQRRAAEQREFDRLEDEKRERERQEQERMERERRERERREAAERERLRRMEEEKERERVNALKRSAAERDYARQREIDREKELADLEASTRELKKMEYEKAERRRREREEELRSIEESKRREADNRAIRERERLEAAERETARRLEDRRSRDKLDILMREKTEKEQMEEAKRALLAEKEWRERRKHDPLSKENLERMTRKPYFSRENLSQPEVITKVERQVIERVDRNLWVDDRLIPTSYTTTSYALEGPEDLGRDRLFNRNTDLGRAGSARTSSRLARSRMDQARRDFISGAGPETTTDSVTDRFRKSTDDITRGGDRRPRSEYRGPLLQKFHDDGFSSKPDFEHLPYPRVGPSPYGQVDETNMDDVHRRSGSVLADERASRRDITEQPGAVHNRSKSADYLMDRKAREEAAIPENELQKQPRESPRISEHELRFRKSTEKLDVPDWYREHRATGRATDIDATLSRPGQGYTQSAADRDRDRMERDRMERERMERDRMEREERDRSPSSHSQRFTNQPFSYTAGGYAPPPGQPPSTSPVRSPIGGFDMPRGMFDRYKDEIEDLRRSRSSLHQLAQEPAPRQEERPQSVQRRSMSQEVLSSRRETTVSRALPGYTVSDVPETWEMLTHNRRSRVIEVADTFVPHKRSESAGMGKNSRYGGRVTIEEVLDGIFHDTQPSSHPIPPEDTSLPMADHLYEGNYDGPSIYTQNYMLMDQVIKRPDEAEDLLREEHLFVRCSYCHRTRALNAARLQYVSCKHCYTYYCSRDCRLNDWPKHSGRCSFARINTLCKDVIMKVRVDTEAQWWMSRVAREGYGKRGRGSVNIRLASPQLAQAYVNRGWSALAAYKPDHLLYYYTIAALVQERKDPSLIALCKKYDPSDKFILSVSIIADVEHCPQTPPPETAEWDRRSGSVTALPPPHSNIYRPPVISQPTSIPVVDLRTLVPTDV